MKTFTLDKQLDYSQEHLNVIHFTKDFLLQNEITIKGETEIPDGYSYHAVKGSEAWFRFLGGWLVPQRQIPIKLKIKIFKDKTVNINIESDMTKIGSSIGMEKIFTKYFDQIYNLYRKEI